MSFVVFASVFVVVFVVVFASAVCRFFCLFIECYMISCCLMRSVVKCREV